MRAMMSLRLDRFFGSWMREFSPDYTAAETGFDQFISWGKDSDFIGGSEALFEPRQGAKRTLVVFQVQADDADVIAFQPV